LIDETEKAYVPILVIGNRGHHESMQFLGYWYLSNYLLASPLCIAACEVRWDLITQVEPSDSSTASWK